MPERSVPIKVFLAEDSALMRAHVARLLGGQAVLLVGEGETPGGCIDAILASRPDVVVLDVQLEGGTGLEVLRAVRAAAPAIAFIVFSNRSDPAYRKKYLAAGASRFIDKTTEFDQLAAAVTAAGIHSSHPN